MRAIFWIDPLHIMGMQPIWQTKQNTFSLLGIEIYSPVKKNLIVLFPRLAAFLQMCKGSILHEIWCASSTYLTPSCTNGTLPLTGRTARSISWYFRQSVKTWYFRFVVGICPLSTLSLPLSTLPCFIVHWKRNGKVSWERIVACQLHQTLQK